MTADADVAEPAELRRGLLEKLMAAVRPEFRVEVYLPDPDDPVLGRPVVLRCLAVTGPELGDQLCSEARRPLARARAARTCRRSWPIPGRRCTGGSSCRPAPCRAAVTGAAVSGCACGTASGWAAQRATRTRRRGPPPPGRREPDHAPSAGCRFARCGPRTGATCSARPTRPGGASWAAPAVDDFIDALPDARRARIDFRGLTPQLEAGAPVRPPVPLRPGRRITAPPPVVNWAIRQVRDAGVSWLLDHDEQQWRADRAAAEDRRAPIRVSCLHAHDVVEMLREGTGWEVEYPRDIWRLHTLPGLTRNPGKGRERPEPAAFRPDRPALAAGAGQTLGPAAAVVRAEPWAPSSPTSRR